VTLYYNIDKIDLLEKYTQYTYFDEGSGVDFVSQPILNAFFIRNNQRSQFQDALDYNLTETNLGPFEWEKDELRDFISQLTHFKIIYELKHKIPTSAAAPFDCFKWTIHQDFDYQERNHISERVSLLRNYCSSEETGTDFLSRYIWLNLLCILFCIFSILMHVKYIRDIMRMYRDMRKRYKSKKIEKRERFREKIKHIEEENKSRLLHHTP